MSRHEFRWLSAIYDLRRKGLDPRAHFFTHLALKSDDATVRAVAWRAIQDRDARQVVQS